MPTSVLLRALGTESALLTFSKRAVLEFGTLLTKALTEVVCTSTLEDFAKESECLTNIARRQAQTKKKLQTLNFRLMQN